MKSKNKGYTSIELVVAFVAIFGVIGWFANIVHIANLDSIFPLSGSTLISVIGVPAFPVGMVMGWIVILG